MNRKNNFIEQGNPVTGWNTRMWIVSCAMIILYLILSQIRISSGKSSTASITPSIVKTVPEKAKHVSGEAFLFFTAEKSNGSIQLHWAVEDRTINDLFEVERSFNGKEYEIIGSVEGVSRPVLTEYSFTDKKADMEQISYYRLKEIDSSGTTVYSCVRGIYPENFGNQSMRLYPTPVTDSLHVSFFCQADEHINITLSSMENDFSKAYSYSLNKGEQVIDLCMNGIPSGNYMIKVAGGETLYVAVLEVKGNTETILR